MRAAGVRVDLQAPKGNREAIVGRRGSGGLGIGRRHGAEKAEAERGCFPNEPVMQADPCRSHRETREG